MVEAVQRWHAFVNPRPWTTDALALVFYVDDVIFACPENGEDVDEDETDEEDQGVEADDGVSHLITVSLAHLHIAAMIMFRICLLVN